MHTLEQLESGELTGIRRLDLSADLQHFPETIFALADTLEVLNLSGNRLDSLPSDLSRLRKLRILFCSDNLFAEVPDCLGDCEQLEMIGFKANQIRYLPAAALPPALRWLILTDNQLQALPDEIGNCRRLQKLMLAGNQLSSLPDSLANCTNLELLRIAANHLPALPDWLLTLPRLSWLAAAGNPFSDTNEAMSLARHSLPAIPREQVILHEQLGQGASGIIYRAGWQPTGQAPKQMAAKLFKGHVTSDGLPHSEMAACVSAGAHPNLIDVAGPLADQPGQTPGLLMNLVEPAFQPLAGPPSLVSCTRDCYAEDRSFALEQVLCIARGTASAVAHLHERGILHGDLYAHNLLVDPTGECLLSDFGAASFFEPQSATGRALQRIESRAFGCLLEELLQRCAGFDDDPRLRALLEMQDRCMSEQPEHRPLLSQLATTLAAL
ncbi:leucine-rich repeat-containing serine/threonine-protein kinase [Pseudomonas songnenensis]|uniref:Protein kinase n=1 Tax=Pseudomonas songnenensis TaxID=1176259 RepID=A0ABX9UPB3_9PSED|nr:leucine-rich repeat-containing protein kinase family protein [Pseudomonas songnenensis]MCQ4299303.1 leucine-rich repeat-containing serine/threonine-protein kinase [Pseudomonas songnenensis]RMH94644.1 protein kinase [Pseudomonas songnenensis]